MAQTSYVIGLDFGTDSVRALLVNAQTGEELKTHVSYYKRWGKGLYCNASLSQFRQHPLDYLESMEDVIVQVLKTVPKEIVENIKGISMATTGSTPVAVDQSGTPLALLPEFADNPNAMFILWKDHTAIPESDEINELAHRSETDFTKYSGGIYSSEWFWSKILHVLHTDAKVAEKAFSWVEHSDWMPAVLTGNADPLTLKRSRCSAGHKAMWHEDFDGLPSADFLSKLNPQLGALRERLFTETYTADQSAGTLTQEWAQKLGLSPDVKVGVGAIDAHFGAVGASIEPYTMVKVMGTSTCDMIVAPADKHKNQLIRGICGQVDGSILPGMLGMEAGQSAFGDLYQWFKNVLVAPFEELLKDKLTEDEIKNITDGLLPLLSKQAAALPLTEDDEISLDWINGRRTPDVNMLLSGAITGLTLGSSTASIFKSLVEATAFGSKAIIERFIEEGIPVKSILAVGGISNKSEFVMQTLSNVLDLPIKVVRSQQAGALGASMFAATLSGIYPDIDTAQKAMSSGFERVYMPEAEKAAIYRKLYKNYLSLGMKLS
jgi:L-ribulokinase